MPFFHTGERHDGAFDTLIVATVVQGSCFQIRNGVFARRALLVGSFGTFVTMSLILLITPAQGFGRQGSDEYKDSQ